MDDVEVVAPFAGALIEQALAGDMHALGRLYGQAGCFVAAGRALPTPLAEFIAARLDAVAQALLKPAGKNDYRSPVYAAAVPARARGRKASLVVDGRPSAEVAAGMLDHWPGALQKQRDLQAASDGLFRPGVGADSVKKARIRAKAKSSK